MQDREVPGWQSDLERCGLEVTGTPALDAPPVLKAIYAVNGVEVNPVVTVPASGGHAIEELNAAWHRHASEASLFGENGEFLIMPPGSGGSKIGWVAVKDPIGENLPSRISAVKGSPDFIAMSLDGRHLCAVSVEDYDYWVVVHEF